MRGSLGGCLVESPPLGELGSWPAGLHLEMRTRTLRINKDENDFSPGTLDTA